jgi:TRAP-type C4-dicarboxylate transport system permease small subunit
MGEAVVEWFALIAVIVVGSVMVWGSYLSASASQISAPASGIPMSYLYLGVMLGYALMVFHAVLDGWDRASGKAEPVSAAEARGALL